MPVWSNEGMSNQTGVVGANPIDPLIQWRDHFDPVVLFSLQQQQQGFDTLFRFFLQKGLKRFHCWTVYARHA